MTGLIIGIIIGVGSILSVLMGFYIIRRRKWLQTNNDEGKPEIMLDIYGSCWTSFNLVYILILSNFCLHTILYYYFIGELAFACCTLCLVHNTAHSASYQFHVHIQTTAS